MVWMYRTCRHWVSPYCASELTELIFENIKAIYSKPENYYYIVNQLVRDHEVAKTFPNQRDEIIEDKDGYWENDRKIIEEVLRVIDYVCFKRDANTELFLSCYSFRPGKVTRERMWYENDELCVEIVESGSWKNYRLLTDKDTEILQLYIKNRDYFCTEW